MRSNCSRTAPRSASVSGTQAATVEPLASPVGNCVQTPEQELYSIWVSARFITGSRSDGDRYALIRRLIILNRKTLPYGLDLLP